VKGTFYTDSKENGPKLAPKRGKEEGHFHKGEKKAGKDNYFSRGPLEKKVEDHDVEGGAASNRISSKAEGEGCLPCGPKEKGEKTVEEKKRSNLLRREEGGGWQGLS